jgi:hypothetical protein
LRQRTAVRLRILGGVTVCAAAIGAVYGARFAPPWIGAALGAVNGGCSGFALSLLEIFLQDTAAATLRRLPLVVGLALRVAVYTAVFIAAAAIATAIGTLALGERATGAVMIRLHLWFALAVALAFNFVFMLRGLFGGRTLVALLTGRYAGPLVVGEMGDMKREIVMLGDTMNTTARIEDVCRATGNEAIASAAVLRAVGTLPAGVRATPLEAMTLRGKSDAVALFALDHP